MAGKAKPVLPDQAIVYELWFEREYSDREDTQLRIGTYASEADAAEAITLVKGKPGFSDYPEGFEIYPVTLGVTGWIDGFATYYYPAKECDAEDRSVSDQPAALGPSKLG